MPKELLATDFKLLAFSKPKRPWLAFLRISVSFLVEISSKFSGIGHFKRISFDLSPKMSEKI